ncbi:MAG: fatty acid hydroxylase [Candidatus Eisenbacteria bacterium]|uniref:Fatty acid hydroxylase n=1 Tax=Eiseniibacteriota bacterium TaxID=2212470 RepID=A0A538TCU8_UNCEI|nr:MAG: fatty acid hydroxylase [Candidatus Eisenbacteria bacterium]
MAKTTYANLPINHGETPIRLFKSDFLELFTHIHPVVVLLLFVPVVFFFLIRAIVEGGSAALVPVLTAYAAGILVWSLSEYLLHRFVFHYEPTQRWLQRVWYLIHGVHHEQPQCKTRLVMPPILSIPLALFFYVVFLVTVGMILALPRLSGPSFAGFLTGYLAYDMLHYAEHHLSMRWGFLKFLKRYHLRHHYKNPNHGFGVSSPVWDVVFGTKPKES